MPTYPIAPFEPHGSRFPRNEEAVRRSNNAGFSFASLIYERYFVDGKLLRQGGRAKGINSPMGEPRLLENLAKVHEGRITPEQFASEFGLLGWDLLHPPQKRFGGDPLKWFRGHAQVVFDVMNLLDAIGRKDVALIKKILPSVHGGMLFTTAWPGRPIQAAQEAVEMLVNPCLEGIRRKLVVGADGIRSVWQPRVLLEVVYWKLADLAEGKGGPVVRRCQGCGSLFIGEDPRRMYCPGKNCGARRRMQLFRKRQKRKKRHGKAKRH